MKIVIAPDSFKGSLSAKEVAYAIKEGILRVDQNIEIITVPMADGGEGTVESLIEATNGKIYNVPVTDPLGRRIESFFGIIGDGKTAVIEMASASGLPLLTLKERNPLITTSYGTGELIRHALDKGCRKIIIGLGGSATNDGGAGMLQALGAKLLDNEGNKLPYGGLNLGRLAKIDLSEFDYRINETKFIIATDVSNPLIGPNGASAIFGPQKGATEYMIKKLDNNLSHYADIIEKQFQISIHHKFGAGAAGGMGGAFHAFFKITIESGVEIIIKEISLKEKINGADLLITGEGQIDFQTAYGKTPAGVASLAKKYNVPTIAIVGSIGEGISELNEFGIESVFSIVNKPMSLEEAFKNSPELLANTAEQIIRTYLLNR